MSTVDRAPASRASAFLVVLGVLVAPILLVVGLRGSPFDFVLSSVTFHLWVVSGIALCALVIAVVAARNAAVAARAHVLPLAVGCLAVGMLMLGHGLTTPTAGAVEAAADAGDGGGAYEASDGYGYGSDDGYGASTDAEGDTPTLAEPGFLDDRPANLWVQRLPVLAVTAFAVALSLVHRRRGDRLSRPRARRTLLVAGAAIGLPLAVIVADPTALHGTTAIPFEGYLTDLVSVAAGVLLLHTGTIHWRRWRLSGAPLQRALTLATWLTIAALVSLRLGAMWHLSWWDYHAFLLAGFGAAVVAIVQTRREATPIDALLDSAFDDDPFVHIVSGYPEALRALVAAVEAKDRYTHGHSARVAELSVRLGIRLGLAPEQLRALARGAYLHDVGKITVPDEILNKPGRLDDDEREVIEQHPSTGSDIVRGSASLVETIDIIRHHHEKMDGTGYPDGLVGEDIPLGARICAVADVWDALTSDRAYRAAMPRSRALGIVEAGRGDHLDPRVVDALVAHLREQGCLDEVEAHGGAPTEARERDLALVTAAAEACHEHEHLHGVLAGPLTSDGHHDIAARVRAKG